MNDKRSTALVTGSSGLIGSEVTGYFCQQGWQVHGVDNNMRANFSGPDEDTRWMQRILEDAHPGFRHHGLDIRDRAGIEALVAEYPAWGITKSLDDVFLEIHHAMTARKPA